MSIFNKSSKTPLKENVWARPKMSVTFRVEVMPGKSRAERTFRIEKVFSNGRVTLEHFPGEHRQGAFEPMSF
ncbi:MAG: hypothetical protein ACR2N3_12285 [Pyrinomonadaceae bacterium]